MKKVCIISAGVLPVPPTQGGAVENLIYFLCEQNGINKEVEFSVISVYEKDAVKQSLLIKNSVFHYVKVPYFIKIMDRFLFVSTRLFFKERALSFRTLFSRLFYLKLIQKYLLKNDFDFIILENSTILFRIFKNRTLNEKFNNKIIYHAHNEPNGTFGCLKQINTCSKVICVSEFIKNSWQTKYPDCKAVFKVVKNGIDTSKFVKKMTTNEKLELRKRLNLSQDDFVIIFAGRLSVEKGIIELAESFVHIPIPNKKLLIVGGAFYAWKNKSSIQKQLDNILMDVLDKVVFTGYVPYDEIYKYYQIADVAVLPSIWQEPAGLTNVEAQLTGLPVITTYCGGIPEYSNLSAKMTINLGTNLSSELQERLLRLYSDEKLRIKIGQDNQNYAIQFSKEIFFQNFMNSIF